MSALIEKYTVVFLLNALKPRQIVLLKRAASKKFAPNLYTGIGGRVEPGEDVLVGAYRELAEETGLHIPLTEFARVYINDYRELYYFWGIFKTTILPTTDDGTLVWVKTEAILNKDIIPSTAAMIAEWQNRHFHIDRPFRLYVDGDRHDYARHIVVREVKAGLGK